MIKLKQKLSKIKILNPKVKDYISKNWFEWLAVILCVATMVTLAVRCINLYSDNQDKELNEIAYKSRIETVERELKDQENELNETKSELMERILEIEEKDKTISDKDKEINSLKQALNTKKTKSSSPIPLNANFFKSWMPKSAISKSSRQGQLLANAVKDENGLYKIDNYYCVAMGSYYGQVGDKHTITLDNGNTFQVILCDIKSDKHTDNNNQYTVSSNCMVEFIVDKISLNSNVKYSGNVSSLPFFNGKIINII